MRSIRSAAKKISSSESSRKNTAGRKQRPKTRSTRSLPNTRSRTGLPDRYEKGSTQSYEQSRMRCGAQAYDSTRVCVIETTADSGKKSARLFFLSPSLYADFDSLHLHSFKFQMSFMDDQIFSYVAV